MKLKQREGFMKRFFRTIVILFGLSLVLCTNVWCNTYTDEINELTQQISEMENALDQMTQMNDQAYLTSEYKQVEQMISEREKKLDDLRQKEETARKKAEEIARKKAEFRKLTEKELLKLLDEIKQLKQEDSIYSRSILEKIKKIESQQNSTLAGDPVLVSSGQYVKTETDFTALIPFTRYYSSGSSHAGVLGKKWATVLDMHLEFGFNSGAQDIYSNLIQLCNYILSQINEYTGQFGEDDYTQSLNTQYNEYFKQAKEYYDLSCECDGTGIKTGIGSHSILLINEKGTPVRFEKNSRNTWSPENKHMGYKSLSKNDGKFYALLENGDTWIFLEDGSPVQKVFRNGNISRFIRDEKGRIVKIENSVGGNLSFNYNGNLLCSVTQCVSNHNITYSYVDGFLSSVTDYKNHTVNFSYTSRGLIKSITKADGSKILFDYQQVTNDGTLLATKTTNEEGFSEHFEYFPSQKKTVYTSMDGNITVFKFDDNEREIYRLDPDGTETSKIYDSNGNLIKETINGLQTDYIYDSNGHFTSVQTSGISKYYSWSEFGDLLTFTDPDGITFKWNYDQKGNPESFYQGSKLMFNASYDERSNLIFYQDFSQKDPLTYTFIYDENGYCKEKICSSQLKTKSNTKRETWTYRDGQPEKYYLNGEEYAAWHWSENVEEELLFNGLKTTYERNNRDDLVKVTATDTVTGKTFVTKLTYDLRHKIISIETDGFRKEMRYTPEGHPEAQIVYGDICYLTWYTYKNGKSESQKIFSINKDSIPDEFDFQKADLSKLLNQALESKITELDRKILNGNKTQITKKFFNTPENYLTETFVYNGDSNLLYCTDALGQTIQNVFSPAGRLLKAQNEFGGFTEFALDSNGFYEDTEKTSSIFTEYDEMGRPLKVQAGNQYDSDKQLNPDVFRTFTYSKDGRKVTICDGGLFSKTMELDAFGNIISITDGDGNTKRYEYDFFGNITKFTDSYNNATLFKYDCLNRLIKNTLPDGTQWNYNRDLNGNCTKIYCGDIVTWEGKYDNNGNLLWEKGIPGIQQTYKYDAIGRPLQISTGEMVTESYEYSQSGRTVKFTDGNGADYIFYRDDQGRLIKETNRLGDECFYQYDNKNRLIFEKDFLNQTITYEYTDDDRTTIIHYSDGTYNSVTRNYAGLITRIQNDQSRTDFTYDKAGNLILQKDFITGDEVNFQYNSRGLLSKRICKNQTVTYYYDKNDRLVEMMDMQNRSKVSFTYDSCGRERTRTFGNGNTQETLYDSAGRPTIIMLKNPRGEILWSEGYVYNSKGQRAITVNEKGRINLYRYDNTGKIKEVLNSATSEMENKLRSDALELGIAVSENFNCFENYYLSSEELNSVSQVLNQMSLGWGNMVTVLQICIRESYDYDKNGNIVKRKNGYFTQEFAYDAENRMISSRGFSPNSENYSNNLSENENLGIQYFYDKNGNLVMKKGLSSETLYSYNASNRLISADVTKKDGDSLTHNTSNYIYDALGRRIFTIEDQLSAKYTLYEGTTFNSIKTGPVSNSSFFTELPDFVKNSEIQSRYLFDSSHNATKNSHSELVWPLEYNSTRFAVSDGVSTIYFSTDLLGSTRYTSNIYGAPEDNFSYDIFGTPVQGSFTELSFKGFAGKSYSKTTGLYDFGYRDYSPSSASFTSSDPVRDGTNWFSYCHSDPLNFIDPTGLENVPIFSTYKMNEGEWKEDELYGTICKFDEKGNKINIIGRMGCAIDLLANIDSTRKGHLTPKDVNTEKYVSNGEVQWSHYAKDGLTHSRVSTFSIYDYAAQEFDNANNYYTGIEVIYSKDPDSKHWVGVNGVKTVGDTLYYIISPTSVNDSQVDAAEFRGYAGWKKDSDGNILVPASNVTGAVIFEEKKCIEN